MKLTEKHITGLGITVGVMAGFFGLVYLLVMVMISKPAGHEFAANDEAAAIVAEEEPAAGAPIDAAPEETAPAETQAE